MGQEPIADIGFKSTLDHGLDWYEHMVIVITIVWPLINLHYKKWENDANFHLDHNF